MGVHVNRSPEATPRGFAFLGQCSRAFARSPSTASSSTTIARDHQRRPRRHLRGRERSLGGEPGRERQRAFNGSGPLGDGVQQRDLDLRGDMHGDLLGHLRGQLGPGLVPTCSPLGPGAGAGGPEGDDRNSDMKDDMAMSLFVSLFSSHSQPVTRAATSAGQGH